MFGAVSLTKRIDIDQYKYSVYGIGFDRKGELSSGSNGFGRNVILFLVNMSSYVHANNKTKNILVLGKGFIQGLGNTAIYPKKLYSINFNKTNTKFCSSLHYNGAKDFPIDNMKKKTELNGYVYDFSVDYDAIAVDAILNIHKYLIEKNNMK